MTETPNLHRLSGANLLIQTLGTNMDVMMRFQQDRAAVFKEFELSDAEVEALADGSPKALEGIGVHPIFRMHWGLMAFPEVAAGMSSKKFIDQLYEDTKEERGNG